MTTHWVVFKHGRMPGRGYSEEWYIIEFDRFTTSSICARSFPSARVAYEWAGGLKLYDWRVGVR